MQRKFSEDVLLSNIFEQEAASISTFNELPGIHGACLAPAAPFCAFKGFFA